MRGGFQDTSNTVFRLVGTAYRGKQHVEGIECTSGDLGGGEATRRRESAQDAERACACQANNLHIFNGMPCAHNDLVFVEERSGVGWKRYDIALHSSLHRNFPRWTCAWQRLTSVGIATSDAIRIPELSANPILPI